MLNYCVQYIVLRLTLLLVVKILEATLVQSWIPRSFAPMLPFLSIIEYIRQISLPLLKEFI